VEEAVHPYISQALAAERVKDMHRTADRRWLARQARALGRAAMTQSSATRPIATAQQAGTAQPAGSAQQLAAPARLVPAQRGTDRREPGGSPADQHVRAA